VRGGQIWSSRTKKVALPLNQYVGTENCQARWRRQALGRACRSATDCRLAFGEEVEGNVNLFDLTDQIAVVVGGTGVLGGAIAEGLAEAGAKVAILGRNQKRGETRVQSIQDNGGTAEFFVADALDRETLKSAHESVNKRLGLPTILVNSAGGNDPRVTVTRETPFEEIAIADWHRNFDLNLVGAVLLPCQEFGPAMKENRKGSVINIASVSGHVPLSRVVAYSAAKAALLNLTQFLAREWAPNNVRVNSITPGFFPGEQNRRLLFNDDGTATPRGQEILNHTSMRRFGVPSELAGAAIFLASEKASAFVTGIDLRVDGGFLSQTI
jgi:NAD(P)-dependent dehydrogenase (short-subunit alcohol dehydrogenase family)